MRNNLKEQLQWLRSCRCWTDAFGARVDAEALGQRVGPPNGAEVLTLACDWEPLWKRARSSRLCGGEVARGGARAPAAAARRVDGAAPPAAFAPEGRPGADGAQPPQPPRWAPQHGHPAALPQPGHPAAVPQPSQPAARQAAGHPAAWQQASGSPPAAWQHAAGHPPAPHPGHPAPQSTGAPPPLAPVAPAGALEQLAYGGASEALVQELRAWRSGRASASRKRFPELTNKTLESIASAVPTTDAELLAVPGIARKKADELGPEILEICRRHALGGGQRPPATPQVVPASPWMERPAKRARQGAPPPRGGVAACAAAGAPAAGAPAAAPSARVEAGMLTGEQRAAAERALRGENLFITGAAGTGKSFLLRYVVQELEAKMGGPGRLAVTAPTGLAAINVGGVTVHSFAGIGIMQQDGVGNMHRYMAARIGNSKVSSQRWRDTDVLVIDEISMLAPAFFDQLEAVARQVRRRREPFGGMQLVLCGDFLQLPPVEEDATPPGGWSFCFQTPAWGRCNLAKGTVILREPVRQAGDPAFVKALNAVRAGRCPDDLLQQLRRHTVGCKPPPSGDVTPTKLYSANRDVDSENAARLREIREEEVVYPGYDTFSTTRAGTEGAVPKREQVKLTEMLNKKVPSELRLKRRAQVILLRKQQGEPSLVNGSRGVVVDLHDNAATVAFDNGKTYRVERDTGFVQKGVSYSLRRNQLPLRLGWALTIHKAQGMTLTRAEVQLGETFCHGQAYVALSRLTGFAGLWIRGQFSARNIMAHPAALAFYGLA